MPEEHSSDGVKTASAFHRYLIALSVGALVFSFSFIQEDYVLTSATKWSLLISWLLLVVSIAGGLFAESRVVVLLSKKNYDIEDRNLKFPAVAQVVTFGLGMVAMGVALSLIVFSSRSVAG